MFGLRRKSRTHKQQLLDELAESYGHLRLAAAHAAGGAAEVVTPSYDRARVVATRGWGTTKGAFSPLYDQMKEGAANARKETQVHKRNKWTVVFGILAAGAAVGAAGAVVARRRRNAAQWDEYDSPPLDDTSYGDTAKDKVAKKAATMADGVSSQAAKVADTLHGKTRTGSGSAGTDAAPLTGLSEAEPSSAKNSRP